jgi:hypothetical protein
MMNMSLRQKSIVMIILSVCVTTVVLEMGARIWVRSAPPEVVWYDETAQLKIAQMNAASQADIVFAGTSMAWQAFDPDAFSLASSGSPTVYNAALNGGVPGVMAPWLIDQVVPRLRPSTVIWGLSSLDLAVGYGDTNVEAYRAAVMTEDSALAGINRVVSQVSVLVSRRQTLRSPSMVFGTAGDLAEQSWLAARSTLGDDGERLDFTERLDDRTKAIETARLANYKVSAADIASILETIDELKRMDIEVIIVALPIPDRYVQIHPSPEHTTEQVASTIAAIAVSAGVQLVDTRHFLSDGDFVDFTHLNQDAASRYSGELARLLAEGSRQVQDGEFTQVASRLIGDFEIFSDALEARPTTGQLSTTFFFNAEDLGRMREIYQRQRGGQSIDTILVGTSQMRNAGDSSTWSESGEIVMNLALSGAGPEVWEHYLLDRLVGVLAPTRVIWGVGVLDLAGADGRCTFFNGRLEILESALEHRDALFGNWLTPGESVFDVLFSDPFVTSSAAVDYYDKWFGAFGDQTLNTDRNYASDADNYPPDSIDYDTCESRYASIENTIAQLVASDVNVVIVGMPTPQFRLDVYRNADVVDTAMQILGERSMQAGAEFVDLTRALADSQFRDYAHVTEHGAVEFTQILEDVLDHQAQE